VGKIARPGRNVSAGIGGDFAHAVASHGSTASKSPESALACLSLRQSRPDRCSVRARTWYRERSDQV